MSGLEESRRRSTASTATSTWRRSTPCSVTMTSMKYVIDASVAAIWVLRAPLTPRALQSLRDDYRRRAHGLIAPADFPHEIANALTKAERQKLIRCRGRQRVHRRRPEYCAVLHAVDPLFYRAVDRFLADAERVLRLPLRRRRARGLRACDDGRQVDPQPAAAVPLRHPPVRAALDPRRGSRPDGGSRAGARRQALRPRRRRPRRPDPDRRRRRIARPRRAVRLRQDDHAAPDRRPRNPTAGTIRIDGRVVNDLPPRSATWLSSSSGRPSTPISALPTTSPSACAWPRAAPSAGGLAASFHPAAPPGAGADLGRARAGNGRTFGADRPPRPGGRRSRRAGSNSGCAGWCWCGGLLCSCSTSR